MAEEIRIQNEGVDLGLVTTLNFTGASVDATKNIVNGRRVGVVDVGAGGGSLIIENRTDDPVAPATGRIWLRTDL